RPDDGPGAVPVSPGPQGRPPPRPARGLLRPDADLLAELRGGSFLSTRGGVAEAWGGALRRLPAGARGRDQPGRVPARGAEARGRAPPGPALAHAAARVVGSRAGGC